MGRPSKYSQEIATAICERLASGESLRAICRDEEMPPESTVRGWVIDDVSGFYAQYARAREMGLDAMADEALEISDEPVGSLDNGATDSGSVNKQRLQVDTRKWLLSKLAPKKYGDKTSMELTGANGGPVEISDADRTARLAGLLALAQQRKTDDVSDLV